MRIFKVTFQLPKRELQTVELTASTSTLAIGQLLETLTRNERALFKLISVSLF